MINSMQYASISLFDFVDRDLMSSISDNETIRHIHYDKKNTLLIFKQAFTNKVSRIERLMADDTFIYNNVTHYTVWSNDIQVIRLFCRD